MSTAHEDQERLLTVEGVSQLLQVAPIFVYRHAREMGAIKVGSHLRFRKARVDEWVDARVLDVAPSDCRTTQQNEVVDRLINKRRRR